MANCFCFIFHLWLNFRRLCKAVGIPLIFILKLPIANGLTTIPMLIGVLVPFIWSKDDLNHLQCKQGETRSRATNHRNSHRFSLAEHSLDLRWPVRRESGIKSGSQSPFSTFPWVIITSKRRPYSRRWRYQCRCWCTLIACYQPSLGALVCLH